MALSHRVTEVQLRERENWLIGAFKSQVLHFRNKGLDNHYCLTSGVTLFKNPERTKVLASVIFNLKPGYNVLCMPDRASSLFPTPHPHIPCLKRYKILLVAYKQLTKPNTTFLVWCIERLVHTAAIPSENDVKLPDSLFCHLCVTTSLFLT